ncbi:MORN repeat-containing protein [uncultured Nostoc sp.]|uniref:MORN repeat-containing protein n=1 Tax=uncultured Nostoc sp. TaxID=340711 RepID=UPI0035CC4533
MSKIRPEVANRRIESFAKRFGIPHLYLAYHAAFPLALTPNLLYRLWANFQRDIHAEILSIPWIAVGDLLLSGLCDEVGYELYEMNVVVRNLLLKRLQEDEKFGQQRINELSDFLLDYVRQELHSDDPDIKDFAQAQQWTALAYTRPSEAARELALAFLKLDQKDTGELIRMASLTETFIEPLAEFQKLVIYARGMEKFARGNLEAAKAELGKVLEGGKQIQVAGVSLPIPIQIKVKLKNNLPPYPYLIKLKTIVLIPWQQLAFIFGLTILRGWRWQSNQKFLAGTVIGVGVVAMLALSYFPKQQSPQITEKTELFTSLPCSSEPTSPPSTTEPDIKFLDGTEYYGSKDKNNNELGKGVMIFKNGSRYDGEFKNNQRNGCGIFFYPSRSSSYKYNYVGQFVNDKFEGLGKMRWKDGNEYRGNFKAGTCEGQGIFQFADGSFKSGIWQNGKLRGSNLSCNK